MKTALMTLCALFLMTTIGACDALKITDPSDPRFNPDKFSFSDYPDREKNIEAFRKLFPVGTPKAFVDRVLIQAGGATVSIANNEIPNVWRYSEPRHIGYPAGPVHMFIFNENNELENINFSLNQYLYDGRITLEIIKRTIYSGEN